LGTASLAKASSLCLQCYLCPGNPRAQGDKNPNYQNTFAFVNDYSAVKEEQAEYIAGEPGNGIAIMKLVMIR